MSNWSYFGGYEYFRQMFTPKNADGSYGRPTLMSASLCGGMAGISYWLSCYPMDVIKARIQAQPDIR
jgi:solute carrier family 25 carnitine/acylcarnitine transporter 20/29